MTPRFFFRHLTSLFFVVSMAVVCGPVASAEDPAHTPVSDLDLARGSLLGWSAIERRVRRGVGRGVRSFRFAPADLDDVTAIAMERAWRAYTSADEPIRNPEGWAQVIAQRVGLDELRRRKRDLLRRAIPLDGAPADVSTPLEAVATDIPDPRQQTIRAERCRKVRQRVGSWPEPERELARLLLEDDAETITAAAWLFREQEAARTGDGTMYPQKARALLEARRRELEELA